MVVEMLSLKDIFFNTDIRELKSGSVIFTGEITDYTDSISFKKFVSDQDQIDYLKGIKPGVWARMQGYAADDQYQHDVVFNIRNLELIEHKGREEKYEGEKRVELHLHTNMSQLDATSTASDFIKTAKSLDRMQLQSRTMLMCKPFLKLITLGQVKR